MRKDGWVGGKEKEVESAREWGRKDGGGYGGGGWQRGEGGGRGVAETE